MKNKHENILILLAFLVFFIFAGIALYSIQSGDKDTELQNIASTDSIDLVVKDTASSIGNSNKLDVTLPSVTMRENEALKIKLQKSFLDFVNMIYEGELDAAYDLLNKEYVETHTVYKEEFITIFNNIRQYNHFIILKDFIMGDRYITEVRFYEDPSNESIYTDRTFTTFIKDDSITYADRGILLSKDADIQVKVDDFEVSITKIIHATEGLYYEMLFLNRTDEQVNIKNIYGIKDEWKLRHEISHSSFVDYELKPMFYRKNLVLFRNTNKLNSIEVELSNDLKIKIDL